MAEEIGSAAGKVAGNAALKSFMSPSIDIIKTIPQGIIELVLRGAGALLALLALISAAACQTAISNSPLQNRNDNPRPVPRSLTFSAAAWVIFLSFWVILYQILAVVQLFLHIKIVYTKVPVINWSLFFLVDIIAIGIAAGGYFCGAIPLAVYAGQWDDFNPFPSARSAPVASSASATSAFSFFSLFLFVGMIGYFFVARYVLKWTTHGEQVSSAGATSSQDAGPDDDD